MPDKRLCLHHYKMGGDRSGRVVRGIGMVGVVGWLGDRNGRSGRVVRSIGMVGVVGFSLNIFYSKEW